MIAVIGSTNIDIVYEVDHFTVPGETQNSLSLNFYFGGKGANQAVAAAKISNQNVLFSTSIGNDSEGKDIKKKFKKYNIKGYEVHQNINTGRAFIEVDKNGENRIVTFPGANNLHSEKLVKRFLLNNYQNIDYCLIQNEIPITSIKKAIEILKQKNIKIIYDPASKEKTDVNTLKDIDYLTPNETEFEYLKNKLKIKTNDIYKSAEEFKKKSMVKNLIIKRGAEKTLIIDEDNNLFYQDVFNVQAIDTTAAGDIFNAGLAVFLNKSNNLKKACQFASAAAAISVTHKGAQSSIPNLEEINTLLKKHYKSGADID